MSGTYEDLEVWQSAVRLTLEIYGLTRKFPKDELYCLVSQIRRAAVSISSNIAEGKGRSSDKELLQFLNHARGSIYELQTQLTIAMSLGYICDSYYASIRGKAAEVGRPSNGLIRSLKPAA